jgi:arabinose-5-phosphate isomerase
MSDDLLEKTAGEVMTAGPRTIRPDALAAEALHVMNLPNKLITALYVVDDNRPIGILHVHDLLHAGVA